jgi:hypothetical protein
MTRKPELPTGWMTLSVTMPQLLFAFLEEAQRRADVPMDEFIVRALAREIVEHL